LEDIVKLIVAALLASGIMIATAQSEDMPMTPPVFYAVRNLPSGHYVAAFPTMEEAQRFVADNTQNGRVKGGMPKERYVIETSPEGMVDMWNQMEESRLRHEKKTMDK
jgi:hypothetical protein